MRTEASIPVDEFDEYTMMGDDTGEFTVTVKELRVGLIESPLATSLSCNR